MRIFKWIIITVLIVVLGIVTYFTSYNIVYNYYAVKNYTVTVSYKEIQNDNNSTHYIIYATLDDGTQRKLKINNAWYKSDFKYHKLDKIYDCFEEGKTYSIGTIGYTIPYLGLIENIIEFEAK